MSTSMRLIIHPWAVDHLVYLCMVLVSGAHHSPNQSAGVYYVQVVEVKLDLCQGNSMPLRSEGVLFSICFNISLIIME